MNEEKINILYLNVELNDLKTALFRTVLQSGTLLVISKRPCLEYSIV